MAASHSRRTRGEGSVYRTAEGSWRVAALIVVGAVSAVVLQTIGYATAPTLVH